ncbi:hypothetical protein K474DRAFT_1357328 [Panus rudis PR-1116 ss-1]|nr:hypothetical protein K474DRAFT_1357328 [Panus rudis PR-1116 ss-1]
MPAFDPVRDAVLNSPVSQTRPLPSRIHIELPPPPLPSVVPITNPSPTSSESTRSNSSPLPRRATDLSMLLNSDPPSQDTSTPLFTPTTPRAPANLSHLLHPDSPLDQLTNAQPLRRRPSSSSDASYFPAPSPPAASSRASSIALGHASNTPTPTPPTPSPKSSPTSISRRLPPKPADMPPPPVPVRSTVPYAPRKRITPPSSVLVPLSPAELQWYKNFPGGIGTQILRSKRKRGREGEAPDGPPTKRSRDVGLVVEHYNARPEVGVVQRNTSPIIGLKNFNNWVKSVLITQCAHPVLQKSPNAGPFPVQAPPGMRGNRGGMNIRAAGKVLDMGCGKGGDLTKWVKAQIREYVGIDIAAVSIDQARDRYVSQRAPKFAAFFEAADCYTKRLSEALPSSLFSKVFPPDGQPFDVVSMQFCMHYAFESEVKARTMLENVSTWMRNGGAFIGTIPNSAQLLEQLDALPEDAEDLSFGNSVYQIRFDDRKKRPLYGHRYWFYLKDAVDNVPEYIVHWDNFVKYVLFSSFLSPVEPTRGTLCRLAAEYDLYPTYLKEFHEVFADNQDDKEFGLLLEKMKVVDKNGESQMDEDQWEAANIYIAFAFEKRSRQSR